MASIFFDSWESLARTACLTILGYVAIVLLLRVSGKRTLAKMNAFDFIVTVALGSCLASVALSKSIPLADGVAAFSLFILLQYALTWLSVRSKAVQALITNSPTLLFYQGEFLRRAMKEQRITEEDIFHACRQQGLSTLDEVDMIILESTGDVAILKKTEPGRLSTLGAIDLPQ